MQVGWEKGEGRGGRGGGDIISLCHCLSMKKTMKSGYILYSFCVFVQNHISKSI